VIDMALKGRGKYYKRGNVGYVYVPYEIVIDSAFPFSNKEQVEITVENGKLIVEKAKE
jgi:HSP20 family molecular chaperone IbpA